MTELFGDNCLLFSAPSHVGGSVDNTIIPSVVAYCEKGFCSNNTATTTTTNNLPRGSLYSIYVNDKIHVILDTEFTMQAKPILIELRSFLFEDEDNDESFEEESILVSDFSFPTTSVVIHIRRDNSSRRKNRKNKAKSIKGELTPQDIEKKKKMRRSLTQEATKKVSFLRVVRQEDGAVLAVSQNMWCRSKTRDEMEKKKERRQQTTTKTRTKNPSTKRKENPQVELVPVELDQDMLRTHLCKRSKSNEENNNASAASNVHSVVTSNNNTVNINEEEIPMEMLQMYNPQEWMTYTNGIADSLHFLTQQLCMATTKSYQPILMVVPVVNNHLPEEENDFDPSMFQSAPTAFFNSPLFANNNNTPNGGAVNLDEIDWSQFMETPTSPQQARQDVVTPSNGDNAMTPSKAISLDDFSQNDLDFLLNGNFSTLNVCEQVELSTCWPTIL
ncbi:hypothetical protein FDP41_007774 [Naegleria fowleri]|uniref:Uncharacterized protein n=1 Tax=Naegleria fowleri TaxID=5763 RepID=A0A6A5CEW4_NAEFO|nr:uncharacterized protein FDP41_007774 [Naegleria fowleri]KAF0983859.1 hypothetical protein FDP41_007774 [Naegleria fowleri]